jgi:hypothetical protein
MGIMEGAADLCGTFIRKCKHCNGPVSAFATYCDKQECQDVQANDPEIYHGEV